MRQKGDSVWVAWVGREGPDIFLGRVRCCGHEGPQTTLYHIEGKAMAFREDDLCNTPAGAFHRALHKSRQIERFRDLLRPQPRPSR
jgi:hypothetical protein